MKQSSIGVAAALLAALAFGCKSSSMSSSGAATAEPDAGTAAAATPGAPPSPSARGLQGPLAIPGATVATLPNEPFSERFAAEAKGRPPGIKPTVEDVYAALTAAGIDIVDQKQHLAMPLGARYCVGARAVSSDTKESLLQISVCECSTPEVAQVARDYSNTTMSKVIPFRTVYANKQTLLVLREEKNTPANDALVAKASGVFAKM